MPAVFTTGTVLQQAVGDDPPLGFAVFVVLMVVGIALWLSSRRRP